MDRLLGINLGEVNVERDTTHGGRLAAATTELLGNVVGDRLILVVPLRCNTCEGHFAALIIRAISADY